MRRRGGFYWAVLFGSLAVMFVYAGAGPQAPRASAEPSGTGLQGSYFANKNLTGLKVQRRDPQVNFRWGRRSPAPSVRPDGFSVRWTGSVEAPQSGTYTLFTDTAGGVRLWVNGARLVSKWNSRQERQWSGRATLEGGKLYRIRLEYTNAGGPAAAALLWKGPGFSKRVVPGANLYPPGESLPPQDPSSVQPPTSDPPPNVPQDAGLWSDPATWPNGVPQAGDSVTIPSGKTVVLDQSTPDLGNLTVNGTLTFANDRNLDLTAGWILVDGKLQVGTQEAPYTKEARITLTSSNESEDVSGMGTKFLGVMGGTLDLHGQVRRGWTRLAQTAEKGSSALTLQDASGWRAGDRIVVASTDYDPNQAEEATVTSVSGNTVTLDHPLAYQHWGSLQTVAGKTVDERAEVGLLSRNIVVAGNAASENDGFGGHMMVMNGGQAHIEGAEFTRMGQKSRVRRYPIHFHMLGDAGRDSYVKDSAIHHTYNRCITVHGTNYTTISDNVCEDNVGHAFFMEDGAEHGNVFSNNLGLLTREPKAGEEVLASDRALGGPATFWITNPDNTFTNNVAAGSDGYGFWFALPQHPMGLSGQNPASASVWPLRTPLKEFSSNVGHSNGVQALRVHDSPNESGTLGYGYYSPHVDPTNPNSAPVVADYKNFTAYKNRYNGVWLSGEHETLSGAKLSDNAVGATFASQDVYLKDSFVVGETENKGNPSAQQTKGLDGRSLPRPWKPDLPLIGYEFYDGYVGAQNDAFANFNSNSQRKSGALGYTDATAFPVDPRNFAEGMTFSNANRVYLTEPVAGKDGDAAKVFLDKDGSVGGTAGGYVVADSPFLTDSHCSKQDAWNAYLCKNDYVGLGVETLSSGPEAIKPLTLTRQDGVSQKYTGCCDNSTVAQTTLISGKEYAVAFNGNLPQKTRYIMRPSTAGWTELDIKAPTNSTVNEYNTPLSPVGSLADLRNGSKTAYFYDSSTGTLHLKIVSHGGWEVASVQTP